jgi:uncharacterized Rmd1/YagE family protein
MTVSYDCSDILSAENVAIQRKDVFYFAYVRNNCYPYTSYTAATASTDLKKDKTCMIYRLNVCMYSTGCTVFWNLTRAEEEAHIQAIRAFSSGSVKQVEVEDMDFCYGDSTR